MIKLPVSYGGGTIFGADGNAVLDFRHKGTMENIDDSDHDFIEECGQQIVTALNAKPADQDAWIPVSERLPLEYVNVLASLNFGSGYCIEKMYYAPGDGWRFSDSGESNNEHSTVMAWKHLPAPYQPQGETDDGK